MTFKRLSLFSSSCLLTFATCLLLASPPALLAISLCLSFLSFVRSFFLDVFRRLSRSFLSFVRARGTPP